MQARDVCAAQQMEGAGEARSTAARRAWQLNGGCSPASTTCMDICTARADTEQTQSRQGAMAMETGQRVCSVCLVVVSVVP